MTTGMAQIHKREPFAHHHIPFETHTDDCGWSSSSYLGVIVINSLNYSPGLSMRHRNQGMSLPKTKIHKEEQSLHIITSLFETHTDDCGYNL
jgi:hypothetical protein